MKILALFQRQFKVEHLVSIHLPMYQLRGSSFRKILWKLGTMQHWDIYIYIHIYIKRFDPSSLAHGICCCIKSGEKMWRFHLESQNMPKWGRGGEWVRVRVSGNVRKSWRECLFRLRVKGLQVTGVGAWEGALTPSVNEGGEVLSSSSLVSMKAMPMEVKGNEPRLAEKQCEWTVVSECLAPW